MGLLEILPSHNLKEYIRIYKIVHFVYADIQHIPYKPYPPKPEHCLSFLPRETETVEYTTTGKRISNLRTILTGQQTEVSNRYIGRDFLAFQVLFMPGALFRITGVPSYELTNVYLDAECFFSKEIKNVNGKLNECRSYVEMVKIVESFLLMEIERKSKEFHHLDYLSNMVIKSGEYYSIDRLAKESCLSTRQYERKFKERMGVSPKYFIKIARFGNAFKMKNKFPCLDWFTLAIQCGYYDYQHLVKDYIAFTGQTPNGFHSLDLNSPERHFGEADIY